MQLPVAATEDVDPRYAELDAWPLANAMEAMWEGQMSAVAAVREALPGLTAAAEAAAGVLGDAGRLIYVGAGTSGRVAVQDGAELTPTFAWPASRTVFVMAGGDGAFTRSVEGAEDDERQAEAQIEAADVSPRDVVIGVAASGSTPFTVAAIARAAALGAVTIGLANNAATPLLDAARYPVLLATGSELLAGSTRMKAGTAQKIALNLISTGIMIRLGRVYRGMMVNMHIANAKLGRRAERMVADIAGCSAPDAAAALKAADGDIKLATLLALGFGREAARMALARHGGNLRLALAASPKRDRR
jgi:N-acetylmuramic acid 6-phosphate etherase